MKKKTKIIIGSCILVVIVAALIAVIVIAKSQSVNETAEDEMSEIWKEQPFDYSQNIQNYSSYKQPFSEAVSELREDLTEASKEAGMELNIVSAYMTDENTPTLIVAYDNLDGGNNYMICRYKNNTLDKTFVHGGSESTDAMDETLAEYIENELPYSTLAVVSDVDSAIDTFVKE